VLWFLGWWGLNLPDEDICLVGMDDLVVFALVRVPSLKMSAGGRLASPGHKKSE